MRGRVSTLPHAHAATWDTYSSNINVTSSALEGVTIRKNKTTWQAINWNDLLKAGQVTHVQNQFSLRLLQRERKNTRRDLARRMGPVASEGTLAY